MLNWFLFCVLCCVCLCFVLFSNELSRELINRSVWLCYIYISDSNDCVIRPLPHNNSVVGRPKVACLLFVKTKNVLQVVAIESFMRLVCPSVLCSLGIVVQY